MLPSKSPSPHEQRNIAMAWGEWTPLVALDEKLMKWKRHSDALRAEGAAVYLGNIGGKSSSAPAAFRAGKELA